MAKTCSHCGAELVDGASFCPYCEESLVEKAPVTSPRPRRKRLLAVGIAVLAVLALCLALGQRHRPKTYEGGAELLYETGERSYQVLLTFSAGDGAQRTPQAEVSATLPDGISYRFPSQLYVYDAADSGADVTGEFLELVEAAEVTTAPEDGARAMTATVPAHDESFPLAALTSHIGYDAQCGTNAVCWRITMKNGDTLTLRQSIHAILQPTVSYYPEDVPMDTLEELQTLLDTIEAEVDPDTAVQIYLPPRGV